MTFDDDFIAFNFDPTVRTGVVRQRCKDVGVEWPPPERLERFGTAFKRLRYSQISDEDRADMTHVCRGAEYVPEAEVKREGVER